MRKAMLLVGVAASLALAPVAHADNFTFGLQGGVSVPTGDYGDAVGVGPMVGVYGDVGMTPSFSLGADIVGNFHGMSSTLKDDLAANGVTGFDFDFTVIQFGGHAKWKAAAQGPWLLGGLGIYNGNSKVHVGSFESTDSSNKFGFSLGAGMDFSVNPAMNFGVGATFHNVTDAIEEFDLATGRPTGNTKSAQYVSIGATMTFLTASHTGP